MKKYLLAASIACAVATPLVVTATASANPSARASSAASLSSLSGQVSSLTSRVRTLERRVKLLSTRHITVSSFRAPLIPTAGTSFQSGEVNCPWGVAVGGGVGYSPGGEFSNSVLLESAPTLTNGWHGTVFSPHGDAASVSVVCASLGWT